LENGTISLILNRRLRWADNLGMNEAVNELVDPSAGITRTKGIATRFTFYIEIGHQTFQRQIQQRLNDPVSIFANFWTEKSEKYSMKPRKFSLEGFGLP
jgi:hypothetical protein